MKNELENLWKSNLESKEIQLDNLDKAKLVFNKQGEVVVENEHGVQFGIEELTENEINLFKLIIQ